MGVVSHEIILDPRSLANMDHSHANKEKSHAKLDQNFQAQIRDTLHKAWKTSKVYFLDSMSYNNMEDDFAGDDGDNNLIPGGEFGQTVEIVNLPVKKNDIETKFELSIPEENWFSEIEKYHYPLVDDLSYEAFHTILEKEDKTLLKMIKGKLIEEEKEFMYACFFCQKWMKLDKVKDHIVSKEHIQRHLEIVDQSLNIIKPDHKHFVDYWTKLTLCQPPGDIMRLRCQTLLRTTSNPSKTRSAKNSLTPKNFCFPHPERECKSKSCQQHKPPSQEKVKTTDVGMQWPELSHLKLLELNNNINLQKLQPSNPETEQQSSYQEMKMRQKSESLSRQLDLTWLAAIIWITAFSCSVHAASLSAAGPQASVTEILVCSGVTGVAWLTAWRHCSQWPRKISLEPASSLDEEWSND